jgi:hypothetical protein
MSGFVLRWDTTYILLQFPFIQNLAHHFVVYLTLSNRSMCLITYIENHIRGLLMIRTSGYYYNDEKVRDNSAHERR